jgi:RNA polymerase sigma-70 factor (ECF subfamily)
VTHKGSIAEVFASVRAQLARVVSRVVGPADIEDIVQETFLRSYEAEFARKIAHPRAFLLKTAWNLALNHVDRSERRVVDSFEDLPGAESLSDGESVESQLESQERLRLFCRAVRELPLQCRRAFLLKKVYGMSQRDIAQYLGISESTVEKHVAKGILRCWTYLDEHGVAPARRPARAERGHG